MNKILIIGNSGLDEKNNSTNLRMRKIFENLNQKYNLSFDYFKLREATLKVDYINYINKVANPNPIKAFLEIKKLKKNYKISIAETFNAVIVSYLIYKFNGTPFIWRQFGTTFNDEFSLKNYFKLKFLIKFILHRIIANSKGCKAIVCTEDGCANRTLYIDKLNVDKEKLYLVKNQRPSVKEVISEKIKSQDLRLIQIGRITSWKKIDIVLNAISNIKKNNPEIGKKINFKIIGQTQDEEYEKDLKKIILDNNLSEQVHFFKDLEYPEIESKILESDISISLTAYNPIVESLQNETPCITYNYGEVEKIFEKTNAVKILCKDMAKSSDLTEKEKNKILIELEDCLVNLYKEKELLPSLGREGKKFIENNFPSLDEHVSEISKIYLKSINVIQ